MRDDIFQKVPGGVSQAKLLAAGSMSLGMIRVEVLVGYLEVSIRGFIIAIAKIGTALIQITFTFLYYI